jgi:competence protein ComEA
MPPYTRRRPRETDPVVAARLQAITFADPYVFVHANDVLDAEPPGYDGFGVDADLDEGPVGGWVPSPPPRPPLPPPREMSPREAGLARPPWFELARQRLEPARTGVAALIVLGLIAAAVAGFVYLRAQPSAATTTVPARASATAVSVTATAASPSPAGSILVDVTGKVRHPGVFKLHNGTRVVDAVRAAGGVRPGTSMDSLNLAAKLTDGQQVAVGVPAVAGAPAAQDGTGAASAPVDLNTATVEQLQTLSGIGPVLAQRIIDYRTAHGPFASVGGLQQVGGIGPSKFAELKDHVTT